MKKYIKLSIMSLAVFGMASCDMDAPSQSALDEQSVFSVYSLAEAEIMSIHVSFGEQNSYRGRFQPYYGVNTDVEWIVSPDYSKSTEGKQQLANYNTQPSNNEMNSENNAYAKFYEGIERANLAINGLRKHGNIENNPDMAHLLGEALTLRAVIYNDLIKAWGDVPARFEPNNASNIYKARENRDVIYKQLLADLLEAEDYCYWPNESGITSTTERVNKSFVKGLRARIALYAGGYGLRGDGYRRSNDPELAPEKMFQIAKDECESIIAQGCNTLGSFEENFKKLCKDNVSAGGESLWEMPYSEGRGRVLFTWGGKHQHGDQFQKNGNDPSSSNHGGVNGPLPTLWYDFDVDDIRRDISILPYRWSADGDPLTKNVNGAEIKDLVYASQELSNLTAMYFGKLRYEWMDRYVTSSNDDGVNWQYMRLADVYLMAAEAENELGNTSAAWNYMKPVLDRALPAAKVSALQSKYCASQQAFREGIYDQRAFEFAGEALRKADLIRWGIIDEKMAEAKAKLQRLAKREGEYADLPEKLYIKMLPDENGHPDIILDIYGLNHGDTDDIGASMKEQGYSSKNWFLSGGQPRITESVIQGFYVVDKPSTHCLWPIWQVFVDNSNGMINNDGNYGQLSD